jgi:polyphosphate kinase 2 (PPK2 family)
MDTGGKDGTVRGVFEGVNPQGCQVWSFKAPTRQELEQDFLWRYHAKAPPRGMIAIFNRSHYEDVLIVRVRGIVPEDVWRHRYPMINEFEHLLTLNRTTILKFFLHISRTSRSGAWRAGWPTPPSTGSSRATTSGSGPTGISI